MNINERLVPEKVAAEILDVPKRNIRDFRERGLIEGELVTSVTKRKYMYDLDSIYRYKFIKEGNNPTWGDIDFLWGEYFVPLLTFDTLSSFAPLYYPKRKIVVTNYGNVWNFDNCRKVSTSFNKEDGYQLFRLMFRGIRKGLLVHRVVAMMFCDNGRKVDEVHHIDGDKTNNRADNLIWVTHDEHIKVLHPLWNKCKKSGDFTEYYAEIQKIKESNVAKIHYKFIIEDKNEKGIRYLLITEDAYQRVHKEGNLDSLRGDEIILESWADVATLMKREHRCDTQECDTSALIDEG